MTEIEKAAKLVELKAAAYDAIVQVASWQKKAQDLEQQVIALQQAATDG